MNRWLVAGLLLLSAAQASAQEQCRKDWGKCTDNQQLVEHYQAWPLVVSACWDAGAAAIAPYGTANPAPGDPVESFTSYALGDDFPRTGVAGAVAANYGYQTPTGERKRTMLECRYDLRQNRVLEVKFVTLRGAPPWHPP
jgi:hypothetical protein